MKETMEVLVDANRAILAQGSEILKSMPSEIYWNPAKQRSEQIGAHFRHVLDHYTSFFTGYENGKIDFSSRERKQEYEQSRTSARGLMADIDKALEETVFTAGRIIEQRAEIEQGVFTVLPMTVEGSLLYLREHAIHHYALVRVLSEAAGHGISDESFGCHPSTLRYLKSNVSSCQLRG